MAAQNAMMNNVLMISKFFRFGVSSIINYLRRKGSFFKENIQYIPHLAAIL